MKKLVVAITFTLIVLPAFAQSKSHLYLEKDYQSAWCKANGWSLEVVLADRAPVDCVTTDYAIEFDFAKKWGESIGQAVYYETVLNKKPDIVLII